jgi:putative addiction module component (TIGR02574 family)
LKESVKFIVESTWFGSRGLDDALEWLMLFEYSFMKLQEVRESALALPRRSRRMLVRDLLGSIAPSSEARGLKTQGEWVAEAEARINAFERGELATMSLDEFLEHVHGAAHGNKARKKRSARV